MPNGLGTGAAIANGANAFVQSFLQAKEYKNKEKLQQNAFLVQLLTKQLEDDTIPYYQRAKILDQIPRLLGVKKMDRNLSEMLGLDRMNEQDVETAQATKGVPGTPAITVTDTNVTNPEMASSITLKGTAPTSDVPAEITKYGNLSPADIKLEMRNRQQQVESVMDVAKQTAIFKAQADILNKGGYTQKVAEGYKGNDYVITMSNGRDTKDIVLPNYTPAIIKKAQIQYAGRGQSGKFAQLAQANEIVRAYEENPTPDLEPQYKAAKSLLNDFEKTGQLKEAQITSLQQGIEGTKPPTKTAIMTNEDRDRTAILQVQKDIDEAQGEVDSTTVAMKVYEPKGAKDKTALANELAAENAKFENIKQEYTPKDPEWKDQAARVEKLRSRYYAWEEEYGKLVRQQEAAKTKLKAAKSRMNMVGTGGGDIQENIYKQNPELQKLSPLSQAYVIKFFGGDVAKAQAAYQAKFNKPLQ